MSRYNDENWKSIYNDAFDGGISQAGNGGEESSLIDFMTPKQIVEELNEYVVGQQEAKELLAISVFNRLLSIRNKINGDDSDDYFFEKNNVLIVGNTGCGKTHLLRSLSKICSLPLIIENATSFTANGYVGKDIDSIAKDLYTEAGEVFFDITSKNIQAGNEFALWSVEKKLDAVKLLAEHGIVYLDEADKIRASSGRGKDVNGRCVQESLLKLIEGTIIRVKSHFSSINIDTSNMLFIFGGAFADLNKIIDKRVCKKSIGFAASHKKEDRMLTLKHANLKDFIDFGMIPELMGRLPITAVLEDLSLDVMCKIFSEPKYSIMSQIINELKSYGIEAGFSDDAIMYIAEEAKSLKLGARGLRAVVQKKLRPLLFNLPSLQIFGTLIITKKMIKELEEGKYEYI